MTIFKKWKHIKALLRVFFAKHKLLDFITNKISTTNKISSQGKNNLTYLFPKNIEQRYLNKYVMLNILVALGISQAIQYRRFAWNNNISPGNIWNVSLGNYYYSKVMGINIYYNEQMRTKINYKIVTFDADLPTGPVWIKNIA